MANGRATEHMIDLAMARMGTTGKGRNIGRQDVAEILDAVLPEAEQGARRQALREVVTRLQANEMFMTAVSRSIAEALTSQLLAMEVVPPVQEPEGPPPGNVP